MGALNATKVVNETLADGSIKSHVYPADYIDSSSFEVCVTSDEGVTCDFQFTSTKANRAGLELKVLKQAKKIIITRSDGKPLGFNHVGVISTRNDCSGPYKWPNWPVSQVHIRDTINIQTYPYHQSYTAKIDDELECALAFTAALAGGDPLPSEIRFDPYKGKFEVTILPNSEPKLYHI